MKELIGFITIIVILLLLLLLAFGFLHVALITLPACVVAISIMLMVLYLFRIWKVNRLNSKGNLADLIMVWFDGNQLHWDLEESSIDAYAKAKLATFVSIVAGMGSVYVILNIIYKKGAFNNLTSFSPDVNLAIGYIISAFTVVLTIIKAKPVETLKDFIWDRANYLVSGINTRLEKIQELTAIGTAIKSIANQLKVTFPVEFEKEIQEFVSIYKDKILTNATVLNALIEEKIKQAKDDKSRLEKANRLFYAAMKLYTVVAIEVNWTYSIPLIKELEYDYEGLTSENLKSLLQERRWDEFRDVVNEIMRDLQRLRELAIKYQEEGGKRDKQVDIKETDEEKAYRTLDIPPTASNEEVRQAYRRLVLDFHPDNAEQTTVGIKKLAEERFKEINWAYDVLKLIRNF